MECSTKVILSLLQPSVEESTASDTKPVPTPRSKSRMYTKLARSLQAGLNKLGLIMFLSILDAFCMAVRACTVCVIYADAKLISNVVSGFISLKMHLASTISLITLVHYGKYCTRVRRVLYWPSQYAPYVIFFCSAERNRCISWYVPQMNDWHCKGTSS